MPSVRIYHNPRCSKSRQTLALLQEKGIEPEIIDYLAQPPSSNELHSLLKKLALRADQLLRKKESLYKTLDLANANDSQLLEAMSKHPSLIERPIVVNGSRAVIGRPPENVLEIL